MIHLISLHEKGSSNPQNTKTNYDKINFHPMILTKDFQPLLVTGTAIIIRIMLNPLISIDTENFNQANPLMAPLHIQPEWYFLFAYAILRSIPSKLGGVLALTASILILAVKLKNKNKTTKFRTVKKIKF
jgi:ubiquinol-cytochrome c reductase cytochrome b subunit